MYFTITVENLQNRGTIKITSTSNGDSPGDINKVRIKRKKTGTVTFVTLTEISISAASDFTYTYYDKECRSGVSYDYQVIPVNSESVEQLGQTATVVSSFDGIFISDSTADWYCELNATYDYTVNTSVSYVKPLRSKFPIRVSNGQTRYCTGEVEGLFLPKDSNDCYNDAVSIIAAARDYKNLLIDFLCNGNTKLLKTYDGLIWNVGIDANPKENFSPYPGASEIKFNWTEIADPPNS